MRIMLVHNNDSVKGGNDVFAQEVMKVLRNNGHKIMFFTYDEALHGSSFSAIESTSKANQAMDLIAKISAVPKFIYNRKVKAHFKKEARNFNPDLVHFFTIYGKLTVSVLDGARELGLKTVLSCNDYKHICSNFKLFHHGSFCNACKVNPYLSPVINKCVHDSTILSTIASAESSFHVVGNKWKKNIGTFLFSSRYMADVTSDFWGADFNYAFLLNPFNYEENYIKGNPGKGYLYFGRLSEEKGVDKLIDAAASLPSAQFTVVGDGPNLKALLKEASDLPNVKFMGPMWGRELRSVLSSCRAVVVPSIWPENFPYVVLQAFAAGKPIIGTKFGGVPEMIGEKESRGRVFDPNVKRELVNKINEFEMMSDGDLLRISNTCQEYVKTEFSADNFYKNLVQIYRKAAS